MPRLSCLFLFSFFILFCGLSRAQESSIETIQGQPSPEVYDLLKDSKGYIWLAHDQGVSRFDGSTFIHLSNPYQNSLSMTDLLEDKKGRIWCHNFTGQIFYIENLKLHLLTQYKYKEEEGFPRMVICGDELVVTSVKGLFVYNLLTGRSVHYSIKAGTTSLTQVGNKVVCYGISGWYSYQSGQPIQKLLSPIKFELGRTFALQNVSFKDTFYFTVNPTSTYYKLTLEGNAIKVHAANGSAAFLNTVSVDGGKVWVHTKTNSYTTDGKDSILGMNLSDIIADNKGYRWMSSLKKGLCIQYNKEQFQQLNLSFLEPGDYMRRMHTGNGKIFFATANGNLYESDTNASLKYLLSVPRSAGIIEKIAYINSDYFIIGASVGLYLYNSKTRQLKLIDRGMNVKEIAIYQGRLYTASGTGVHSCTLSELIERPLQTSQNITPLVADKTFNNVNRCRGITVLGDSLIAAYSEGIYIAYKGTVHQLLYNNHPIYASKIKTVSGKILIGTYNQGLLIIENGTIRNLTEKDGLLSNNIKTIKTSASGTWLVYNNDFQKLNSAFTAIEDIAFYFPKIAGVNDVAMFGDKLYIAANEGVYRMSVVPATANILMATHIDKVTADGKEMMGKNKLAHFQNYLQFTVSTPYYAPYSKITYQYRVRSAADSTWQMGASGQSTFDVVALKPGVYTFEIVATDKSKRFISLPAVYRFEIVPPWYQTWTFRGLIFTVMVVLGFFIVRYYYKARLRKQRTEYEKILAIQSERHRISSEIHDDIGAGLSALRLLTEMTKDKLPESEAQHEVSKIHASISELSQKMREVIWSLNTDNDHLKNLLYYIQRQANLLFENSPIRLKVLFPTQDIPELVIKGDKRRHIYLAVKEALHNCLKHSGATTCQLSLQVESQALLIIIADNGKGFAPIDQWQTGSGLTGMKKRMQQINGYFEIQSKDKTEVRFIIPLKEEA